MNHLFLNWVETLILMIIFSSIFVLFAYVIPASFLMRPEYFFSFAVVVLAVFDKKTSIFRNFNREILLIFLLAIISAASIFVQNLVGNQMIWKDLMILVRYTYYGFAILAGAYLASKARRHTSLALVIQLLVITSMVISIFQYYNVININFYMVSIYGQKYETLLAGDYWRRIIGTFGNPNYWGLLLDFCLIYCSYMVFFKRNFFWLIPIPLLLASILFTGSRTALVALVLSSFVSLYLIGKLRKVHVKTVVLVSIIFFLVFLIRLFFIPQDINVYENKNRFSADNISTLEMRVQHWRGIVDGLVSEPYQIFIGGGPSKSSIIRFGDNMYLRYLRDYGVLGLVLYLFLLKTIFDRVRIVMKDKRTMDAGAIYIWCFVCFVFFDLAADAWFNVRIVGVLLFLYGYIVSLRGRE